MKHYRPPKRLIDLFTVLKYDSECQDDGKPPRLSPSQRFCINQERCQIMKGNNDYQQDETLETLINDLLTEINAKNWEPRVPILMMFDNQPLVLTETQKQMIIINNKLKNQKK